MTAGPQIPETPPEGAKRAPVFLVHWTVAIASWLCVWPVAYALLLEPAAPANKIVHWLTVSGFTLWVLSLFGFYGILTALAEYSPILRIFLTCVEFVFEALWFLASLG